MLIDPAFAQDVGGAAAPSLFVQLVPFILIFVIFYFLLIRPQQKKMKEHQNMLAAIRRGDQVVTGGGLIGTVKKLIGDEDLQIEIAEGVQVRAKRGTIAQVLAKTEPASNGGKSKKKAKDEPDDDGEPDDDDRKAAD